MSESVTTTLKRAAICLADELDYERAAESLKITSAELERQISTLEKRLCCHIFKPSRKKLELTNEGKFLIQAFRRAMALHERNASRKP